MKLNEARYFRQPRPFTRKRIAKMRLIPDMTELRESVNSSPKDRVLVSPCLRSSARSRDRCVTLNRDQRSTEIGSIFYTCDSEKIEDFYRIQSHNRDTFVETDPETEIVNFPEVVDSLLKLPEVDKLRSKYEMEKEVQVKMEIQIDETDVKRENNIENSKPEVPVKSESAEDYKPKIADEPKVLKMSKDRHEKSASNAKKNGTSESERSIWSRYGSIRKILDFFGHFFEKRASGDREKESMKTEQRNRVDETSIDRSPNITERNNRKAASAIKNRTKRSSKRNAATTRKNAAIEEPKDRVVSGLTKQIMNTRDKRLRATLLEHELRTRKLEEENRRYKKILVEKLKTRQMSSPLH